MSIRKASSRTTVNSGVTAAAAATINQITVAPATATTVAGGGTLGGVTISNVSITDSTFANVLSGDTAVSSSGGFVRITGTGFKTAANVFLGTTLCSNTFVSSTQINANIPANSAGTYQFYVFNTDGSGAAFTSGLTVSGPPTWTTTNYTTSTLDLGNIQLLASGDAPLTYYIQPGSSNPQNLTVNSAGYLSGTVSSEGAYTITVIVDDAQNQSTQADITVTVSLVDPYFNLTTLLLSGNGANNANNISFVDSSTNNFTVTRNGGNPGMSQGTFSPYSQTGWSNYFDGTGDYLTLNGGTALTFGTGGFTIEFWVNPSQSANEYMMVDFRAANGAFPMIGHDSTRGVFYYLNSGYAITSNTILTPNAWHYICVARSGSSTKLFINGTQAGSTFTDSTNLSVGSNRPAIGINGTTTNNLLLTGYISNLRIIKGTAVYTTNFTPPTSPLTAIANTSLLTCQSNRFVDSSTNAFAITRAGDVSVQAFSPFAPIAQYSTSTNGGSGYFDGNGDWLSLSQTILLALGTGDFTWESWIYLDITTIPSSIGIYDQRNGTNGVGVVQPTIELTSTNGYAWYSQASNKITSGAAAVRVRAWQHLAVCRSSGTTRMFLDGAQVGSDFTDALSYPSGSITIGRANDGVNTRYFTGYFSNMRVLKGTALYTGAFTPPTAPLTAVANTALLLNFTNAGVFDATGKNTVETVADAKISTAQSKFGGSSMAFDGTGDYLQLVANPLYLIGTSSFTIEAWIYSTSIGAARTIFSIGTSSTTGLRFYINNSDQLALFDANASRATAGSILVNTWHHVAVVRNGTSLTCYLDGIGGTTVTYSSSIGFSNQAAYVGRNPDATAQDWIGYIEDLRFTVGFARYQANFSVPTSNHKLQ